MNVPNQKQRSVMVHDFSMNTRADVPRSVFPINHGLKVPFSFSNLIPILIEEVLPGDTWKAGITVAARTAIPIVPIQDNWKLEFFSFFIPMRLLWDNAPKFWGEQDNPGDSIAYTIPTFTLPAGGPPPSSIWDYMGIPCAGQIAGGAALAVNILPLRAYNLVYNEWFRDENLQSSVVVRKTDGGDLYTDFNMLKRGKRFDYINQALPWPQKGNTAISLPLGTTATVKTNPTALLTSGVQPKLQWGQASGTSPILGSTALGTATGGPGTSTYATPPAGVQTEVVPINLYADLTTATAATINQLRQAITLQQYLEKDARGGTRYTEFVYNHFGVRSPDARLQRPEFIGGGSADILTTAIPQTSATGVTGSTTPIGGLGASGHVHGNAGFTYSATEHGFLLTLVSARADITYQQGLRKMWSRSTRYDYPVPLLANLGEQALLNKEIYCDGSANDANVFGYVPRWDEYRHIPSRIAGIYRSTSAGTIDYWHSSEKFASLPALNAAYITDKSSTVLERNFAAGASSANQQILADFYFHGAVTRALPAYGIPGLTRF